MNWYHMQHLSLSSSRSEHPGGNSWTLTPLLGNGSNLSCKILGKTHVISDIVMDIESTPNWLNPAVDGRNPAPVAIEYI